MQLVASWFWANKLLFSALALLFNLAQANYFLVDKFLFDQGYKENFDINHGYKKIIFKKTKQDLTIELSPYNHFFKINDHSYYLNQVLFYGQDGLVMSQKDIETFKKIISFYEEKKIPDKLVTEADNNPQEGVIKTTPSPPAPVKNNDENNKSNKNKLSFYETKKNKINFIFLDPGHGGKDPGAIFYAFKEKDLVLDLTLRLYNILKKKAKNINVLTTRKSDKYLSLENRTHLANSMLKENDNGIFISTHLNIWLNPETRGMEVYYLGDDKNIFNQRVENLFLLENNIKNQDYTKEYLQRIFSHFKVIQFQNESLYLAEKIIANTYLKVKNYPIERGVKKETFYVLNGALMPAILLELGFISNQQDLEFLLDKKKSDSLLQAIANSILTYIEEFNRTNGFSDEIFYFKLN